MGMIGDKLRPGGRKKKQTMPSIINNPRKMEFDFTLWSNRRMFLSIWSMQNWHIILSFNAVMGLSRVTRIRWKERITIERERIKEITERQAFLACDSLASPSSPSYLWHHVEAYSVKFAATEKEVLSWAVIWSNLTVSYLELHSTCHNLIHSSSTEVCL